MCGLAYITTVLIRWTVTITDTKTAQERFDKTYISASDICNRLKVCRSSIGAARKRGLLPEPIVVALGSMSIYLWERDIVRPYVDAWELTLKARRRELIA